MSRALYISNYTLLLKNVKRFLHFIFTFFAMNKDVLFLTIPRTLTKNPVPLHLQKQGTHSLFQKKIDYVESADLSAYYKTNFNELDAVADWIKLHHS